MIVVAQRVSGAAVRVGTETVGRIGTGLCLLACAMDGDEDAEVVWLAHKLVGLRVFPDERGRAERSLHEAKGAALVVPQFTLAADWVRGRRPGFTRAALPRRAQELLGLLEDSLSAAGVEVARGRFGSQMTVELLNEGPFTLVLDSRLGPSPGPRVDAPRAS